MANIRMKIKDSILHYLCDDWNNRKRGRAHKENQALFDRKDGYALWTNTDLEMVMEKVIKGIYAVDFDVYEKEIRTNAINGLVDTLLCLISTECEFIFGKDCTYYAIEQDKLDALIFKVRDEILNGQKN